MAERELHTLVKNSSSSFSIHHLLLQKVPSSLGRESSSNASSNTSIKEMPQNPQLVWDCPMLRSVLFSFSPYLASNSPKRGQIQNSSPKVPPNLDGNRPATQVIILVLRRALRTHSWCGTARCCEGPFLLLALSRRPFSDTTTNSKFLSQNTFQPSISQETSSPVSQTRSLAGIAARW